MLTTHSRGFCRGGLSLIELLVVLGLIGLLLGLILPAVESSRHAAAKTSCQNNLRQVGLAVHSYHDAHRALPPAQLERSDTPEWLLTWQTLITPQMDQEAVWLSAVNACRVEPRPYRNPPHIGYATVVPAYVCPADARLRSPLTTASGDFVAFSSYLGVSGGTYGPDRKPGVLGGTVGLRLTDITDGTSATLMVGERPPPDSLQAGQWYAGNFVRERFGGPNMFMSVPGDPVSPQDAECRLAAGNYGPGQLSNPCDRIHFWSLHRSGSNFLFADGSVRFLSYAAKAVLPAMATRAGGEVVEVP